MRAYTILMGFAQAGTLQRARKMTLGFAARTPRLQIVAPDPTEMPERCAIRGSGSSLGALYIQPRARQNNARNPNPTKAIATEPDARSSTRPHLRKMAFFDSGLAMANSLNNRREIA
jgi:hypothetical protein